MDISGFSIQDGVGARHVFAPGTIVPGREAVVVFGGGSPFGPFGNAAANGLVFTASTGTLGLNNGGDTVTIVDASGMAVQTVPVDAVVYGGSNASGLIDETGVASAPEVGDAPAGSSIERITVAGDWQVQGVPTPNGSPL